VCMEPTSLRTSGLSDGSEDMKEVRMVSPLLLPPLLLVLPGCGAMSSLEVAQPMTMRDATKKRVVLAEGRGGVGRGREGCTGMHGITRPCPPARITFERTHSPRAAPAHDTPGLRRKVRVVSPRGYKNDYVERSRSYNPLVSPTKGGDTLQGARLNVTASKYVCYS